MTSVIQQKLVRSILYFILISFSLMMFIPLLWGVLSSFKTVRELFAMPPTVFPETFAWENYLQVIVGGNFLRDNYNSLVVAVLVTFLTVLICSLAGHALAKYQFRGRDVIFYLFLGTMMIPVQVTMIPVFLISSRLDLIDTYLGVVFPQVASAFGVFLMRQFIMTVPDELIEAARIDGCPEIKIFTNITVPLSKIAIGSLSILTFLGSWNQFLWPLILIRSQEMATVQLAMRRFQGEYTTEWNLLMAAAVLAIVPVAIVYICFQRFIVEGISMSGIKG